MLGQHLGLAKLFRSSRYMFVAVGFTYQADLAHSNRQSLPVKPNTCRVVPALAGRCGTQILLVVALLPTYYQQPRRKRSLCQKLPECRQTGMMRSTKSSSSTFSGTRRYKKQTSELDGDGNVARLWVDRRVKCAVMFWCCPEARLFLGNSSLFAQLNKASQTTKTDHTI